MKTRIYSVYDAKAQIFGMPIFFINDAFAIRAFTEAVNTPDNALNRYAEDMTFYCIGTYDDHNGSIESFEHFVNLGFGLDFRTTT